VNLIILGMCDWATAGSNVLRVRIERHRGGSAKVEYKSPDDRVLVRQWSARGSARMEPIPRPI